MRTDTEKVNFRKRKTGCIIVAVRIYNANVSEVFANKRKVQNPFIKKMFIEQTLSI